MATPASGYRQMECFSTLGHSPVSRAWVFSWALPSEGRSGTKGEPGMVTYHFSPNTQRQSHMDFCVFKASLV